MARRILLLLLFLITSIGSFILGYSLKNNSVRPLNIVEKITQPQEKPFEAYYVENLAVTKAGKLKFGAELVSEKDYTSNLFELEFYPNPRSNEKKITTGVINLPVRNSLSPLVVMIRGYVDQKIYSSGTGTRRAAEYFAKNGFITVAPDFLGYGGSSPESGNIFETRFQTYTAIVALHKSLDQIPQWDGKNIFIWAHSNGGQIALTWIAAENLKFPTVLWAPVTKPFPYSVLYYTDESADGGKLIRKELSKLEENYDVDKFSFTNYFERLQAPIQLHQGTLDDAVPVAWSSSFVGKLQSQKTVVDYFTYPGDDHNLSKNWNSIVEKSLEYYKNNLQ